MTLHRAETDLEWREVEGLVAEFVEWIKESAGVDMRTEQRGYVGDAKGLQDHFSGENGCFFLARLDGVAVGCVGLSYQHDGRAELKRMYIRPDARGHGLAPALMVAVLAEADERGCTSVWLETGRGIMDRAIALYARFGFRECRTDSPSLQHEALLTMERSRPTSS